VTVDSIDLAEAGDIVAVCSHGDARQSISLRELPLPTPPSAAAQMDRGLPPLGPQPALRATGIGWRASTAPVRLANR
jgi:hypothetical protein